MSVVADLRDANITVFDALKEVFSNETSFDLLKIDEISAEFTTLETISSGWSSDYGDTVNDLIIYLASEDSDIETTLEEATHLRFEEKIWAIDKRKKDIGFFEIYATQSGETKQFGSLI